MSERAATVPAAPRTPPAAAAVPGPRAPSSRWKAFGAGLVAVLSSYALAIVLLLLLLVLTFFGTLEQTHTGLLEVQRRYFESVFVIHDVGWFSIPLPGASVVLTLLALNLVVGGVVRIRKRRATVGIIVAHLGILLLLAGSFVEWLGSDKGHVTLFEQQSSAEFSSYHDWELVVRERADATGAGGAATEHVLPSRRLMGLERRDVVRFASPRLPFDVEVSHWAANTEPERVNGRGEDVLDGWRLKPLDLEKEAERNLPGALVSLRGKGGGPARARTLVWGLHELPWVHEEDGRRFEVELRKVRWPLPFRVTLERFVKEEHPGTRMPRRFSSYVVRTEDGVDVRAHITMNAPLRHKGYTLYQSGWGPQDAGPGTRLFSTFSVVRNPTDRVPEIACWVIFAGLLWHFVAVRLVGYLRRQAATRDAGKRGKKEGA